MLSVTAFAAASGCTEPVTPVQPAGPTVCTATEPAQGLAPLNDDGKSSTIALGSFADGPLKGKTLAFVADEDARAVLLVDVDEKKQIASVALATRPGQLVILPDGRVLVALRGSNRLGVLHPQKDGTIVKGCEVETSAEPIAMTVAGDDVLVVAGWGRSVDAFAKKDLAKKARVEVAREPREIVVADDGKRAFVSHAMGGRVTVLDLGAMKIEKTVDLLTNPNDTSEDGGPEILVNKVTSAVATTEKPIPGKGMVRIATQGYAIAKTKKPAGRVLLPQVLTDPGDRDSRPQGYGVNATPGFSSVGIIDAGTQRLVNVSAQVGPSMVLMLDEDRRFGAFGPQDVALSDCLLPRTAALHDQSSTLLVGCLGIDTIIGYEAASAEPAAVEKVRWNVASGPTGIAIDAKHDRAIVFAQFERALEILKLSEIGAIPPNAAEAKHDRIELPKAGDPLTLPMLLGRQIFFSTGDARVSVSGLGCASCHPDGRDDGLTWATPDGPRRTLPLAGRLGATAPYAWDGESKDLPAYLSREFKRLRGQGLRSTQLDALLAYIDSIPPPPKTSAAQDPALVQRGKAVFTSAKAACSSCHTDGATDKKAHDVHSKTTWDRKGVFDTPSLVQLSGRDPYFHDGRYATLKDFLKEPHGSGDGVEPVAEGDRAALEAYLLSL